MGINVLERKREIGVLAKEDSQVILSSLLAIRLLCTGWHLTPVGDYQRRFCSDRQAHAAAWAMRGDQDVLIRGLDSASFWPPAVILSAYAAGFFLVAVWCFRKVQE